MALALDAATLQAALVGYSQQLEEIQAKMDEIRRQLGKSAGRPRATRTTQETAPAHTTRKNRMSAEGRARIAAAQKARWAKAKKAAKKAERADAAGE